MAYRDTKTGKIYEKRIGSRVEVKRGKAYKTSGGLKTNDIIINKHGRYVSAAKHRWGRKHGSRQLGDAGYDLFTPGDVGTVRRIARKPRRRSA